MPPASSDQFSAALSLSYYQSRDANVSLLSYRIGSLLPHQRMRRHHVEAGPTTMRVRRWGRRHSG